MDNFLNTGNTCKNNMDINGISKILHWKKKQNRKIFLNSGYEFLYLSVIFVLKSIE